MSSHLDGPILTARKSAFSDHDLGSVSKGNRAVLNSSLDVRFGVQKLTLRTQIADVRI